MLLGFLGPLKVKVFLKLESLQLGFKAVLVSSHNENMVHVSCQCTAAGYWQMFATCGVQTDPRRFTGLFICTTFTGGNIGSVFLSNSTSMKERMSGTLQVRGNVARLYVDGGRW